MMATGAGQDIMVIKLRLLTCYEATSIIDLSEDRHLQYALRISA